MAPLTRDNLLTLEAYAKIRKSSKPEAIAHRKLRSVGLGEHMTLQFEDEKTIRRQIQEMLHIEKIFDEEGILSEIEAYAPLIPDGTNWKATLLVEFPDAGERRIALASLKGVEDRCWVQVSGHERVFAIADEDLERENDEKTSSVHFLRFELTPQMIASFRGGAAVAVGIDHPNYTSRIDELAPEVQAALARDFA